MKSNMLDFSKRKLAWMGQQGLQNVSILYWKTFFETAYFLRLSPYYFEWNQSICSWESKTSLKQKVICLILTVNTAIFVCISNIQTDIGNKSKDPAVYFQIASLFSVGFYCAAYVWIVWSDQKKLLEVFNKIQRVEENKLKMSNFLKNNHQTTTNGINEIRMRILYFTIFVTQSIMRPLTALSTRNWDFNLLFKYYQENLMKNTITFMSNSSQFSIGLLTIYFILSEMYLKLVFMYGDVLFISTTLFFRALVKQFVNELNNPQATTIQISGHYKNLKKIVMLINNAVGFVTFTVTLGALPFYCEIITLMPELLQDPFFGLRIFIYFVYLFGAMFVACKSHKEVDEIYQWLHKDANYSKIAHLDLHLLLHDISLCNIGLMSGGHPLSYKLLRSILGLTATYVVINLQFQPQNIK